MIAAGVGDAMADGNFSQAPGFAAYFSAHARTARAAGARERRLLARYRPRFMLPAGHPGMIDFYRDYIAHGELRDGRGKRLASPVSARLLNAYKQDPRAVFSYRPGAEPSAGAVVYGRIERANVDFSTPAGPVRKRLAFLTYHAVFATSGLPASVTGWRAHLLGLIADLNDWHQLDHYTAATVVLDPEERPIALVLQQHNYQHSYLFGERIRLPADGRVPIDVAIRSNELYPWRPGRSRRRAVRFADRDGMRYLLGYGARPLASADDLTHGIREAPYRLEFLAPDDAFYSFQGYLGARRWLPGRDGPPGADYNTLPALKPWPVQAFVGYWRAGNAGDRARFESALKGGGYPAFARAQAAVFYANWQCLRRARRGCRLR